MSILFVLLMFLLVITISYFRSPAAYEAEARPRPALAPVAAPKMQQMLGMSVPVGYWFHPGHTWALKESMDTVRVGLDSFAAQLAAPIDRIEVLGENRWVRQGQKVMKIYCGDAAVELVSPIEGVITAINHDAVRNPQTILRDPYEKGWVAQMKSPDLAFNQKNLMQGAIVAPWLQNSLSRLYSVVPEMAAAMSADGGLPVAGLLRQVSPEARQNILKEFFLA